MENMIASKGRCDELFDRSFLDTGRKGMTKGIFCICPTLPLEAIMFSIKIPDFYSVLRID
jgi:hypothetical protein